MLVDPVAWSNLAREIWVQKMAHKAVKHGFHVAQGKFAKPMKVAGVGNGTNLAEWEVRVPIALHDIFDNVTLHEYQVPVVSGSGRELPALLGLQSMASMNGVLEMSHGREYLTLPGPGGYTITWSPGTVRYRLAVAPSGHLLLPCDEFENVSKKPGGLQEPKTTFFGTEPVAKKTCEIGVQTESDDAPKHKVNNRKPRNL